MKKALFLTIILLLAISGCGDEMSNTDPVLTGIYDAGPPPVINLSWTKIDRAIYYEIFESVNLIGTETSTSFIDHGPFISGHIYIYTVRAYMKDLTGLGHIYGPDSDPVSLRIP